MDALSGGCFAEVRLSEFAGTWLLKYQNRNILEFSLRIDNATNNQLIGTLVRPLHFAYDTDGDFANITPQQVQETVSGVSLAGEQLGFSNGKR